MQDRSRYEEALLVDPDDCERVLFWWPGGDGSGVVRLDVRFLKGCYPIRVILTDVVFTRGSNQAKCTAATHTLWPQLSSSCGRSCPFLRSRSRPPAAIRKRCWSILTTANTFSFVASRGRGYMSTRKRRTDEGEQCAGHKASLRQRRRCSLHSRAHAKPRQDSDRMEELTDYTQVDVANRERDIERPKAHRRRRASETLSPEDSATMSLDESTDRIFPVSEPASPAQNQRILEENQGAQDEVPLPASKAQQDQGWQGGLQELSPIRRESTWAVEATIPCVNQQLVRLDLA